MFGKNHLFIGILLWAFGSGALRLSGQSSTNLVKNEEKTSVVREQLTPREKQFNERRLALIKRRRQAISGHVPDDNASRLLAKLPSGEVKLDNRDQRSLTQSLLEALDVPISSQLLVFSGSASQGTKVNPKNPRAIYFNDEVYIGVVPGGLLEMIGVDAKIGGVLYTFQGVGTGRAPSTTGGADCARCHSRPQSGYAQGFFVRSVIPNDRGMMVGAELLGFEGHERPLGRRFGGWFVTSAHPDIFGRSGLVAETDAANSRRVIGYRSIQPGQLYDTKLHLGETSDILVHLLHEHQIGFHNHVARVLMSADDDGLENGQRVMPTHQRDIEDLVEYMLFRREAALPENGIVGNPQFIADFSRNRHAAKSGAALKDLELTTRLLKHRCSYMIYTRPWAEMPPKVKGEVYAKLHAALFGNDVSGRHLPREEKRQIIQILRDTLPDLPADWK